MDKFNFVLNFFVLSFNQNLFGFKTLGFLIVLLSNRAKLMGWPSSAAGLFKVYLTVHFIQSYHLFHCLQKDKQGPCHKKYEMKYLFLSLLVSSLLNVSLFHFVSLKKVWNKEGSGQSFKTCRQKLIGWIKLFSWL